MKNKTKFPVVSLILMLIFLIGGSLLLILPHGAHVIFGMDIPSFIIVYAGYLFVIGSCFYHIHTGK